MPASSKAVDNDEVNARDERLASASLIAAFLLYAGVFIYRTSFVVAGERYFSLFDDAMVSMRYARNLAHGSGLVWNAGGPRVEGYTNLLWTLYMALIHRLPVSAARISLIIQVTSAAALAANLYVVRRIALAISKGSVAVTWGALMLTAFYLPLNFWSLQGMEVGVLVLFTSVAVLLAIRTFETGAFSPLLYVVLAVSILVRPDMVIPSAAMCAFMAVGDRGHRGRHLVWGTMALVIPSGAHVALSMAYYGELLPNTYYLKLTGVAAAVRIARGAYVLARFIWRMNVVLFLLPFALALRRDRRILLLLTLFAAQAAYSVYVGGDAWEYWGGSNRYISIAMPGFFVLLAEALRVVAATFGRPVEFFAVAMACAVISVNSIHGPDALGELLLVRPPLHTGPGGENQDDVETALAIRGSTTADATIAVMRAGTIPYFSERPAIDLLGKSDRRVAREPARLPPGRRAAISAFRPGHVKFDFAYSIAQLAPDMILQLRRREPLASAHLDGYVEVSLGDTCVYARRASPHLKWDHLSDCPRKSRGPKPHRRHRTARAGCCRVRCPDRRARRSGLRGKRRLHVERSQSTSGSACRSHATAVDARERDRGTWCSRQDTVRSRPRRA